MRQVDSQHSEHEAVAELLPWYLNRTLDDKERQRVVDHMTSCESCRAEGALLDVALDSAAEPAVSLDAGDERLARVMARIDSFESSRQAASAPSRPGMRALLTKLRQFFTMPQRPAAYALGLALAALGGAFAWQSLTPDTQPVYEVRSDEPAAPQGLVLVVVFQAGLVDSERAAVLQRAGIDGSVRFDSDNRAVVSLPEDTSPLALGEIIRALEADASVRSALTEVP